MSDNKDSFPHRINPDGTVNNNYVDVLDEDKPIAGQKFACVSFISPEKIIKQIAIQSKIVATPFLFLAKRIPAKAK